MTKASLKPKPFQSFWSSKRNYISAPDVRDITLRDEASKEKMTIK